MAGMKLAEELLPFTSAPFVHHMCSTCSAFHTQVCAGVFHLDLTASPAITHLNGSGMDWLATDFILSKCVLCSGDSLEKWSQAYHHALGFGRPAAVKPGRGDKAAAVIAALDHLGHTRTVNPGQIVDTELKAALTYVIENKAADAWAKFNGVHICQCLSRVACTS